jgi:hypothetical protein
VPLAAVLPVLLALHERHGLRLVIALSAAAVVVDAVAGPGGQPVVAAANLVLVWAVPVALGLCWADGLLAAPAVRTRLALAGASGLTAGTMAGPFVVPDALWTSLAPPTSAIALLAWVQAAVVVTLAPAARRWLRRPRVWAWVVGLNLVTMHVYVWHVTVLLVATAAAAALGLLATAPLSAGWWATRPLWLAVLAVATAVLVLRLSRRARPAAGLRPRPAARVTAALVATAALAALVAGVPALPGAAVLTTAAMAAGAVRPPVPVRRRPGPLPPRPVSAVATGLRRRSPRRLVAVAVLAVAGVAVLAQAQPAAGAAAARSAVVAIADNRPGAWCGTRTIPVPDAPLGHDFGPACAGHDHCRARTTGTASDTLEHAVACHQHFLSALLEVCASPDGSAAPLRALAGASGARCDMLALAYWLGANLGDPFPATPVILLLAVADPPHALTVAP